jgi:uncharacterized membrane protein
MMIAVHVRPSSRAARGFPRARNKCPHSFIAGLPDSELTLAVKVLTTNMTQQRAADSKGASPTYPFPQPVGLSPVLDRNIKAICERRQREAQVASWEERAADAIARFTGSMTFIYVHLLIFGVWIVANLSWLPGVPAWDESFVVLAMVASVEAIFLSTFVLITQNRMAAAADKRADLDLQISLLSEHEITKLATLVSEMARQMGIQSGIDHDVEDIKKDVAPEAVLDKIERTDRG